MSLYVQYGCGFSAPKNWKNYDASPTLRFERTWLIGKLYKKNSHPFPENVLYGDIVKGLPEQKNTCDGVYCSHVLEHLPYQDFQTALKNTYRILKPGGIFRCVVPDLKFAIEKYLKDYGTVENPASDFMRRTLLGKEKRSKGFIGVVKDYAGNSKHLWMWDEKSLVSELEKSGFKNCRICFFNDSKDEHFKFVEEANRFNEAIAIECTK